MTHGIHANVHVYPSTATLAEAAATKVLMIAREAIRDRGRCNIALSGGNTPRALYEAWASDPPEATDWAGVHLFWGDERCVPPDHEMSNERMAWHALIKHVPMPAANVHPIDADAEAGPDAAARAYEDVLRREVPLDQDGQFPVFGLVLLGMGADGHTASLFPGDAAFAERRRWVMPALAPRSYTPRQRITLTLPVINNARHVIFLVTGADKRETLRAVLNDPAGKGSRFPAAHVRPTGELIWMLDAAAAP